MKLENANIHWNVFGEPKWLLFTILLMSLFWFTDISNCDYMWLRRAITNGGLTATARSLKKTIKWDTKHVRDEDGNIMNDDIWVEYGEPSCSHNKSRLTCQSRSLLTFSDLSDRAVYCLSPSLCVNCTKHCTQGGGQARALLRWQIVYQFRILEVSNSL